ncbi:lysophospholipid acyltransferase LPEAT2-like [Senna tora]|uniref:Lysophospholipid acyltransferase LPEAT2-like n=1 Tax=Senna tora TaxID=362788 RepID=A0A835CA55_9FABA|nr:lysophospholipid acyltransferase LPEAT2-like [Senna tora]
MKELRLSYVEVSGEDLEYLLSSCSLLETLAVMNSSHSKLKQLQLISCRFLLTLEISAANLVSFTYNVGHGMPYYDEVLPSSIISIDYKHIPNLKQLCFGGANRDVLLNNFLELATYDHLSCLKIGCDESNYEWGDFEIKEKGAHAYNCVEEVKVIGFGGTNPEVEFIEGIIKNSPNLKKLIVDPISPYNSGVTFENKIREIYDYSLARTCARNMEPNIPSQVEFVVLTLNDDDSNRPSAQSCARNDNPQFPHPYRSNNGETLVELSSPTTVNPFLNDTPNIDGLYEWLKIVVCLPIALVRLVIFGLYMLIGYVATKLDLQGWKDKKNLMPRR